MRIYTRGGDDGSTGLFGGARVSKAHVRVEAYGAVDELNAVLGWVRAADLPDALDAELHTAQASCLTLGAFLACVPGKDPGIEPLCDEDVKAFEDAIDRLEEDLEPLRNFILPGGCETAARLQVARTVCRRAERALVGLGDEEAVDALALAWLNRLSDLLFVQARWANHHAGQAEQSWQPRGA